jgi:hypothetical protein
MALKPNQIQATTINAQSYSSDAQNKKLLDPSTNSKTSWSCQQVLNLTEGHQPLDQLSCESIVKDSKVSGALGG